MDKLFYPYWAFKYKGLKDVKIIEEFYDNSRSFSAL